MKRFVEGEDRLQGVLLPEFLDDYVAEDNPVRVIYVFVDELDLRALGSRAWFRGRRAVRPTIPPRTVEIAKRVTHGRNVHSPRWPEKLL